MILGKNADNAVIAAAHSESEKESDVRTVQI